MTTESVYDMFLASMIAVADARDNGDEEAEREARDNLNWLTTVYPFHARAIYDAIRGELDAEQTDVIH